MNFYRFDDLKAYTELGNKNLNAVFKSKWCDAEEVDRINGDCDYCPVCGRPVSLLKWLQPRKMKLSNIRYPDRLSSWLTEPLVITKAVKETFLKEKIKGIESFAEIEVVKVCSKKAERFPPPQYYSADIVFSNKVFLDTKKSIILGEPSEWQCSCCNPFGTTRDAIVFVSLNAKNWDGNDIFKVYGLGTVVSQKFYDIVKESNFTNFNLYPIENVIA